MLSSIKAHIAFLVNLLIHKWYVLIESWELGILWRGIIHDMSKLRLKEWIPRVKAYQKGFRRIGDSELLSDKEKLELDKSWIYHYHNNPHHWQWWVTMFDNGELKVLPMADKYRREMLADWLAVSRMPNRMDIVPWYLQNKENIILHPKTRAWIENQLNIE